MIIDSDVIRLFLKTKVDVKAGMELRYDYFKSCSKSARLKECPWLENVSLYLYYFKISLNREKHVDSCQFWKKFKITQRKENDFNVMRRSNCFDNIPQGTPGDITFFWLPSLLITLFLPWYSLVNHFNCFILQCSRFLTHTFFLRPRCCTGAGWYQNNLTVMNQDS